jgi:hypothetical protein
LEKAVIIQGVKRTSKYKKRAERTNMKRRESVEKRGRWNEQKRDERKMREMVGKTVRPGNKKAKTKVEKKLLREEKK